MKDFLTFITETRSELGMGSSKGRSSISKSHMLKPHTHGEKSKVVVYKSITDALRNGYMGQIFSTENADRLYVITKSKWGKDKEQIINGRSAKGFTPENIPSKFKDIKKYSMATMVRHSGKKV